MSRISQFKLINGGGYRISYEDETNEQVITSLLNRWGDGLLTVTISGKIIEINHE